jgi:hypothetical protein
MTHVCECEAGQPCTCGRPRGRQVNAEMASEGIRLGQLQSGMYEAGSPHPTPGDVEFLTSVRRPQNCADAGRLLAVWGEQGLVPGYTPRRSRPGAA